MKKILAAGTGLVAAALAGSGANAATITAEFVFSGLISAGGVGEVLGPDYPVSNLTGGTVRRQAGTPGSAFATVSASGFDDPVDGVTFANGANAFGAARAMSNNRVIVTITNENQVAETLFWNGTIFGGGVGIVVPSLRCDLEMLDTCGEFFAPGPSHAASAEIVFGATLDGQSLFDGRLFVDDTQVVQSLNGISLDNLRPADDAAGNVVNDQFLWWDETDFGIDLGILDPGETMTLEFFVMTDAIASGNDGCFFSDEFFFCTGAQAGFGDPDSNGGDRFSTGFSYRMLSFESGEAFSIESAPVPLPAGVWLFGTMLAGAAGARRLQKKRA